MSTATQVQNLWLNAVPAAVITLDSDIGRLTLKPSKRAKGSPPVTIRPFGNKVTREPEVGSSDTIILKSGLRDLIIDGSAPFGLKSWLLACSRSGIKTEGPAGARKVTLLNLIVDGGWNAETNLKGLPVKWLAHHLLTGGWAEVGVDYVGCADEHARYFKNLQGNHYFGQGSVKWCGRTALQVVNRMNENGTPMPEGYGDVTVEDESVEDVCLEQGGGGSAYTFRGGMKDSVVTLNRTTVRLGCNAALHTSLRGRATGALVMDSGPESAAGAGDAAWPGGTKELHVNDADWQTESVYDGTGSAERSCVKVAEVGLFSWNDGRIVVPVNDLALEIFPSCKAFWWSGSPEIVGKVRYWGATYPDWASFTRAHPETHDA
jgi:hypothetical protein